jgi:hypothetical protein
MTKDGQQREQQIVSFIDHFGFCLAVELLGACCVSKALKDAMQHTPSSRPISLQWRSSCREQESGLNAEDAHIFNVNITFQLVVRDKQKSFSIHFGALVSSPAHTNSAVFVQSKPWTQGDLELYAAGTGICVDETGPQGMANIVASSLTNLQDPKVLEFNDLLDDARCNPGIKLVMELYHSILFERVKINLHSSHSMSDGEVGPVALCLMINVLKEATVAKVEEAKTQVPSNFTIFTAWLQSANGRDDDANEKVITAQTSLEVNECDHSKIAPDLSSVQQANPVTNMLEVTQSSPAIEHHNASPSIVQDSYVQKRKMEEELLSSVPSKLEQKEDSSSTKQTTHRPGLVHGAVRKRKRKKGKLTFGKT